VSFNELNSVEHYIIHQLCGVNLNSTIIREPKTAYGVEWQYRSANELQRGVNEVMVESELKAALIRLNPEITQNPALADEVIYKLRAVFLSVNQVGLVKTNEEFFKWLTGEKTMPFGENNRHVPVRLVDFDTLDQQQLRSHQPIPHPSPRNQDSRYRAAHQWHSSSGGRGQDTHSSFSKLARWGA
jgi:type I restriction enzyme R subunit